MKADFFQSLAAPGVQQLKPYQPGKPVEELERELGICDPIKLASNENPLGPGAKAQQAAQASIQGLHFYPDGSGFQLTQALAKKHRLAAECITLGNGSNDVLELIARAFLTPHHSAVFSEYAFAVYPIVTQAIGAQAHIAKAFPADHAEMPYGHDLEAIYRAIDQSTRVVFIANPNNPTGTWLEPQALQSFLARVPEQVIVVLDEAYYEYMPDSLKADSESLLQQFPNLVVTRTFSKIYALAGLRIGYALSHPEVADLLNRVRQPFNVNSVAQSAALAAIDDQVHLEKSVQLNRQGLAQLAQGLKLMGLDSLPSIGNFITVDFKQDAAPIDQALLRQGVIVRPLANYRMPNHLRITVGTTQQNERVLQAIASIMENR